MKVSICMITYNHENYIAQAIESVLMQKVSFDYELIIGEDYSTDKTREITLDYKRRYPDKIRLLLCNRNQGMMNNFLNTLKECSGKYIALLDGDDYWTDIYKLQKQVDFLEANLDFSICFHSVKVDYQSSEELSYISNKNQKVVTTTEDLMNGNFIHTPSCMFRNGLIDKFPRWFTTCSIGDWPLHMLNSQFGKISYSAEVMAVYRVHDNGVWESKDQAFRDEKTIETYERMLGYFDWQTDKKLRSIYTNLTKMKAFYYLSENENKHAFRFFVKILRFGAQDVFSRKDALYWMAKIMFQNLMSNNTKKV